jgi:hypothetical protein
MGPWRESVKRGGKLGRVAYRLRLPTVTVVQLLEALVLSVHSLLDFLCHAVAGRYMMAIPVQRYQAGYDSDLRINRTSLL